MTPDASIADLNGKVDSDANATRIAPDLSNAPRVVSILETPDVAVGCVDPTKRRIVASTRFSSRVGAERKLYASSLPFDHGKTWTQLEQSTIIASDGSGAEVAPTSPDATTSTCVSAPSEPSIEVAAGITVPIRGAWEAQSVDLATSARNPMAMELDHESVVVGCADGLIYRIHLVGSEYGPDTLVGAAADKDTNGADGAPGVGDATITDLLQLHEVWKEIMVPEDDKDHPGRLKRDGLKEMGLK